jgi:hypothetical protein
MRHSVGKLLTAGVANTLFTVPMGYKAEVSLLFISNHTGGQGQGAHAGKSVSAYWQHAHNINHKIIIIDEYALAATEFIKFNDATVVMQSGDSMVLTPESGSEMSAIATFDLRKEPQTVAFDGE